MTIAQCLAPYFGDLGKFSTFFSVVFQASTGKKLWEKTWKNFGTQNFDAKHPANVHFLLRVIQSDCFDFYHSLQLYDQQFMLQLQSYVLDNTCSHEKPKKPGFPLSHSQLLQCHFDSNKKKTLLVTPNFGCIRR